MGWWGGVALGALLVAGCAPSAGRFEHRYPSGQLRMAGPTRNGRLHGEVTTWRASGTIESRGTYRNGARHGLFLTYDDSGTVLTRKAVYAGDRVVWSSTDPAAEVPASLDAELVPMEEAEKRTDDRRLRSPPSFVLSDPIQGDTGAAGRADIGFPATGDSLGLRIAADGEMYWGDLGAHARLTTSEHLGGDIDRTAGKTVVDLGALHRWRPGDHVAVVRIGMFAPVTPEDPATFAADRGIAFSDLGNTAYYLPRVIGLRASASIQRRVGPVFGRFDAGVDYAQTIAGETEVPRLTGSDLIGRSALAIGGLRGPLVGALELGMAATYRDAIDPPVTSAVSLHLPLDAWQLRTAVVVPLTGDDAGDAIAVVVGACLRQEPAAGEVASGE